VGRGRGQNSWLRKGMTELMVKKRGVKGQNHLSSFEGVKYTLKGD